MRINSDTKTSPSKTTVNLFIDANVLADVRKEAKASGISLNSHINKVLTDYVTFYRRAKELECVALTGNDFRFILDNMDEEKMLEHFKSNLTDLIPAALNERKIPATLEKLIEYEYAQMAINAGIIYKFTSYHDEDGLFCLLFQHRFGIRWSRILAEGHTYQIKKLFDIYTRYTISPSNVVITILDRRFNKQ